MLDGPGVEMRTADGVYLDRHAGGLRLPDHRDLATRGRLQPIPRAAALAFPRAPNGLHAGQSAARAPATRVSMLALDICDWLINNMSVSTAKIRQRSTAEERREAVIEAAIAEFGEHGYHAGATGAIAKRAGISQPYIYALFPDKETLFLACYRRGCDRIRHAFAEAARGAEQGQDRITAMGSAYVELLQSRRELMIQLQAFAAASDPSLRPAIRESFLDVMGDIRRLVGGDRDDAAQFTARGMLLNILTALEVPADFWPTPLAEGRAWTFAWTSTADPAERE